jgi:hypothetical protein
MTQSKNALRAAVSDAIGYLEESNARGKMRNIPGSMRFCSEI